jgi:beta-lactamase class A
MLISMNILMRLAWTCIVLCLIIGGAFWVMEQQSPESQEGAKTEQAPVYTLDESTLAAEINALLSANTDLDTSVSIVDLQTGKSYHYGETESYTAASIGKLLTATLYMHKVELGQASMTEQVGSLAASSQLEKLIVESDNTAWHELNDRLTSAGLQQYAQSLGLQSYNATANTVDSEDIATLLNKLARGKLLNNANTTQLLSLLQRADMRSYIVAGAPEGSDVYHKVGYLADRLHDAAIVKKGDRSYVLVVFSKAAGKYDFSRGATLFKGITGATSQVFFGASATTTTGE